MPIDTPIPTADFHLGTVLVEPGRLRLSSPTAILRVQARVMDVIVVLAASGGAVVSRQALESRIWGTTHVGYHALARAVYEARKALEVVAPGQTIIETIPRRGYRTCISGELVLVETLSASASPPTGSHSVVSRLPLAAVSVLVLGLVMHAANLHGSAIHLTGAAVVLAGAIWRPPTR